MGWFVLSAYVFSGSLTLSEIYAREMYESIYDPII